MMGVWREGQFNEWTDRSGQDRAIQEVEGGKEKLGVRGMLDGNIRRGENRGMESRFVLMERRAEREGRLTRAYQTSHKAVKAQCTRGKLLPSIAHW